MVDFNAVLRRARDASKLGVTGVTGVTSKANGFGNNGLENLGPVTSYDPIGVTCDVLPRNAIDNKWLDKRVTQVTPVTYRPALTEFKQHRPHGVTRFRHDQAVWAAEMFIEQWGNLAAEFGWSTDDIFAHNGLAYWLGVEIVTALGPQHAVTEANRIYDRVTNKDWLNAYGAHGNG